MKITSLIVSPFIAFLLLACQTSERIGLNSLINMTDEAPGINCLKGGVKIESGIDTNSDNQLSSNEVTQTKFVCNGANGLNSITSLIQESAGANCAMGGYKFQVGLDANGNSILDATEVQATKYICGVKVDKLERIEIGPSLVGSSSFAWQLFNGNAEVLTRFNKLNYGNVDSITFVTQLLFSQNIPGVYAYHADLYNITDGTNIQNSEITKTIDLRGFDQSSFPYYVPYQFFETRNFYNSLPAKDITIGLRMRVENANGGIEVGMRSYLFVYRH